MTNNAPRGSEEIVVRQATLADREAIFAFIRQAYAGRWQYKIPKRWTWQYRDNPFLEGDDLPIWIAVDGGGRVVGQTCAMVEPLQIGTQTYRLGWSVDTYLLPEYRGRGVGFRLQQANDRANPLFMSLSMSAANRRIKEGLGSVALAEVATFDRPARYRADAALVALCDRVTRREGALRRLAGSLFAGLRLHHLATGLLNRRLRAQDEGRLHPPANVAVRELERFGPEADRLWEEVAPHFTALVRRDREFLNWKFTRQPHVHHRKFAAYRDGAICGHLILRCSQPPEANVGLILDLFAAPGDREAVDALLIFAVRHLQAAGVGTLEAATPVPAFQAALRRVGFHQRKVVVPMLNCRLDPGVCRQAVEGNWLLGLGDHDWDQYPNA